MLERLLIKNFALVSSLELDFGKGLVLLTGETGAGKSLLIGALSSLLGSKPDNDLILSREEEALVEGVFSGPSEKLKGLLTRMGLQEGDKIVVRRRFEKKGKSSAFVNNCLVTPGNLKEIGRGLIEINGQHQSVRLLDEESHSKIIDSTDQASPSAKDVSLLAADVKKLSARYKLAVGKAGDIERRIESLKDEIFEIEKVKPKENEDEELGTRKAALQNMSKITEALSSISSILSDEGTSAPSLLKELIKRAETLAGFEKKWACLAKEIEQSRSVLLEIKSESERESEKLSFNPEELEHLEERLYQLEKLKRKYGPLLQDVLIRLDKSRKELDELNSLPPDREVIKRELDATFDRYLKSADALSVKRKSGSSLLSKKIEGALKPLALEKARFQIEFRPLKILEPDDATEKGFEEACFLFSANEGEELKPLSKIASGGEISRVTLAILSVTGSGESPNTVVFDEVDAGIGGSPAEKVGSYLSRLAGEKQVICITHLPQIAAYADRHFKVEKSFEGGRTTIKAFELRDSERIGEIARMLAGETVAESAKAHARELLKSAKTKKRKN